MIVRESERKDMGQIMEMIGMAKRSLSGRNVDQWQDGYPNEEVIAEDIRRRQSYVAEEGGKLAGTAVISFEKEHTYDEIINGKWLTGDKASYVVIRRIATHDDRKRQGVAGMLLRHAEKLGRKQGAASVRIDTHPDNLVMQTWLKKNAFTYCGWIYLESGALRYAYEKVL